jgi:outer membrane protein OmpA-like peptidoglycan-associated protein
MRGRRRNEDEGYGGWPGLVDVFAFSFVVVLLLYAVTLRKVERSRREANKIRSERDRLKIELNDCKKGVPSEAIRIIAEVKAMLPEGPQSGNGATYRIDTFEDGREILFRPMKYDLAPRDSAMLGRVARRLAPIANRHTDLEIWINGTADPNSFVSAVPPRNNVELSALRASGVSKILREAGLRRNVYVKGLGEVDASTTAGKSGKGGDPYARLRRVYLEFTVAGVRKTGS